MLDYTIWFNRQLDAFGDWEWTESGVDVILTNKDNKTIKVKQLLDFFDKIDVAYLGIGNLDKLYDVGLNTPEDIINATESTLVNVVGENGKKIRVSLVQRLTDIPLYKLVGAHSTQRGIGVRRMRLLEMKFGSDFINNPSTNMFETVDKFDTKMAKAAVEAINAFNVFFPLIKDSVTFADTTPTNTTLANTKVCFTGFRDKALQAEVEAAGGTIQSGVSSKTDLVVTVDPNGTSSKLKKARTLEKKIISVEDLKGML